MYYSLALAEACPAQVSERWMDAAFVDRKDFDFCRNRERESSKQPFSAGDIIGQKEKAVIHLPWPRDRLQRKSCFTLGKC